jgi:pimeloyl-ACP methyl ester carboxylesterase
MTGASESVQRCEITVDGAPLSYLHAGSGPPVLPEFRPLADAERDAHQIPGARLLRIPHARHIPTVDDPRAVAAALLSFLR